jgi:hypothetical protein
VLVAPTPDETILLYISATSKAVSSVLVVEREEEGHALKVQRPVYFISEVLSDTKTRYSQLEKLVYAEQNPALAILKVVGATVAVLLSGAALYAVGSMRARRVQHSWQ